MDYAQISKETISHLYKAYGSLKNSPLDPTIQVLVELSVSLKNGCSYCITLHTKEARELGVSEEKIEALKDWRGAEVFSPKEKMGLQWAEEVTILDIRVKTKEMLNQFYSEREVVDLTACASIMNALNRLAISLKTNEEEGL